MRYVYKTRVPFSQTGVGEGFSVIGAAQIIEDSVCAFFAEFGKDSATLNAEYNAVWIFVKNKFRRLAVAAWNEEITVESFFTRRTAATLVADTVVRNSKGETCLYARTETCVLDCTSQRIRRIASVGFPEDMGIYPTEAGFDFERFDTDGVSPVYEFNVPSSAIDFCMHVNNVEYLRFVVGVSSVERELVSPIKEAEIHFVNQAREGEKITVSEKDTEDGTVYEIACADRLCARCRIKRKEISN
ncbi:MAG: hypothetical protein J6Y43_06965 [Clostridia bacterium]|nr:hypothetical protein [Clostridia bacterium]